MQAITRQDFPLPKLGPKLEAVRDEVVNGKGFHLIQGEDARLLSWCVLLT